MVAAAFERASLPPREWLDVGRRKKTQTRLHRSPRPPAGLGSSLLPREGGSAMRTLTLLLAMPAALAACNGGTLRPGDVEAAASPAPRAIVGPEPIHRKAW